MQQEVTENPVTMNERYMISTRGEISERDGDHDGEKMTAGGKCDPVQVHLQPSPSAVCALSQDLKSCLVSERLDIHAGKRQLAASAPRPTTPRALSVRASNRSLRLLSTTCASSIGYSGFFLVMDYLC